MLSSLFLIISTSLLWHLVFRFSLNTFIFPHTATQTALSLKTNSSKNLQVQQKLEQNIPTPRAGWELLVCSCRCPGFWTTWSQTEFRASGNALRPVLGKTVTKQTNGTRTQWGKLNYISSVQPVSGLSKIVAGGGELNLKHLKRASVLGNYWAPTLWDSTSTTGTPTGQPRTTRHV